MNNIDTVHNPSEWNSLIEELSISNLYLTWMWGEYKARKGWNVTRLRIRDERSGKTLGIVQLQSKIKGFITIFIIQGGVHLISPFDKNDKYEYCIDEMKAYIAALTRHWVLIVDYSAQDISLAKIALLKSGFTPILTDGMFTYLVDCKCENQEELLSGNWRHNLKRAIKNDKLVVRWAHSKCDRMSAMRRAAEMYATLIKRKQFISSLDIESIADLVVNDHKMVISEALLDGEVVAVRVAYVCSDHAFDFLAASNESAKNCYANYLLIWEMISFTRNLGKEFFDTGGINPYKNMGVFNFKKGLGGRLAMNGPMWVAASNRYLGLFARTWLTCQS